MGRYGSSKLTKYEILNIGLSDTFKNNQNQRRATSGSVKHNRKNGVQNCFEICKRKDGLALTVTFVSL